MVFVPQSLLFLHTDISAVGNYWTSLADWPPYKPLTLYMNTGNTLTAQPPALSSSAGMKVRKSFPISACPACHYLLLSLPFISPFPLSLILSLPHTDTYVYDPLFPVPTFGGDNLFDFCGPRDESEVNNRDDVILFTSDPLPTDTAVCGKVASRCSFYGLRGVAVVRLCYLRHRSLLLSSCTLPVFNFRVFPF